MARSADSVVFKKNTKLESFLKRALSDETYERIRAHESCIVVSEKDSKAFKYVILSDEWVYLTENPPKVIQEVVHLKDIVSVELVNDFPDFLSGSERENTQHLAITYLTSDPQKRRSFRWKSSRSPRGSVADSVSIDRSNASTPLGYAESVDSYSEDFGYNTQSNTTLNVSSRPNSRSSSVSGSRELRSSTTKKKKKPANDSADHDSILRALKEVEEDHVLEDIEEDRLSTINHSTASYTGLHARQGSLSSSKGTMRPLPNKPKTPKTQAFEKSAEPQENSKAPLVVESSSPRLCSTFICCSSRNEVSPADVDARRQSLPPKLDRALVAPDIEVEEPDSRRASIATIQPVPNASLPTSISYPPLSRSSRLSTPLIDLEHPRSGRSSSLDLQGSLNGLHLLDSGSEPRRKAVLNIYLLNLASPMLMLIRSAWSNYLMRSTLCLDPLYKHTRSSVVRKSQTQRKSEREKTELLYGQLKRELLNPTNKMEENFQLLNELRLATEKSFMLKKLFWRSSDVFLFLVRNMQRYLPRSAHNISTDIGRQQRADEMEFAILLTEILSLMFRESEIIHTRIQTLKAERGKAVLDLLMALTCTPELPEKLAASRRPPSRSAKSEDKKPTDEDFSKMMGEFTGRAITTVFELFLMARQANWGHTEGNFFNISWMVKVLEEIRTTEKFLERVLDQLLELISGGGGGLLSPQESVTMYQHFTVINTFLEFSPRLTNFITNTYQEEFKYYFQAPLISRKLPPTYPITPLTLNMVEQVVAKVLRSTDPRSTRSSRSPRQAY